MIDATAPVTRTSRKARFDLSRPDQLEALRFVGPPRRAPVTHDLLIREYLEQRRQIAVFEPPQCHAWGCQGGELVALDHRHDNTIARERA